jgi:hypothetical protein
MAAKAKEYRRLPGQGIRRQGFLSASVSARRARLWLGRDHLLAVESQWYSEDYRRFYFRDIQAVIIRKTIKGMVVNMVLIFFGILTLLGVLATSDGAQIFWVIMTSVFGVFLLVNSLSGPTCVCQLRTAVQTEEMPSLRRLWRARKVIARVRPFIAEAQGQLAPDEIAARLGRPACSPAPAEAEFPASAGEPPPG